MSLQSDLTLDASKFEDAKIPEGTHKTNSWLIDIASKNPQWYEVGAPKYREMRARGETPFPKPIRLDHGEDFEIPSRESGRMIPCRLFRPKSGKSKGVFMHVHGGGWVLMTHDGVDTYLDFLANAADLTAISVGYRLAPEHPFPAGPEDCYDAAEYFMKNSESNYGGPLMFFGGESAGAHLSVLSAFHLRKVNPSFHLRGLALHFGFFDLTLLPAAHQKAPTQLEFPILNMAHMVAFINAACPNYTLEQKRNSEISPIYADFRALKPLPPALFTCGTEDPLIDDSVFMAAKWRMVGGEAVVRIYEGAPHGYIAFPPDKLESAGKGLEVTKEFLQAMSK